MKAVGWENGSPNNSTGSGYGIRISIQDRDTSFKIEWSSVKLDIVSYETIEVNLSKSFWNKCTELRSAEIGKYMIGNNTVPEARFQGGLVYKDKTVANLSEFNLSLNSWGAFFISSSISIFVGINTCCAIWVSGKDKDKNHFVSNPSQCIIYMLLYLLIDDGSAHPDGYVLLL